MFWTLVGAYAQGLAAGNRGESAKTNPYAGAQSFVDQRVERLWKLGHQAGFAERREKIAIIEQHLGTKK